MRHKGSVTGFLSRYGALLAILTLFGAIEILSRMLPPAPAPANSIYNEDTPTPYLGAYFKPPTLERVSAIHITDDWAGYNTFSPILAHFDLVKVGEELVGTAYYSICGGAGQPESGQARSARAEIKIPSDVTDKLLKALKSVPIEAAEFKPQQYCCDDYPSASIIIERSQGSLTFGTNSPQAPPTYTPDARFRTGVDYEGLGPVDSHYPWSFSSGGEKYQVNSDLPDKAIGVIWPYLHTEVMGGLFQEGCIWPSTATPTESQ